MKSLKQKQNLSVLCEMLFEANYKIYQLENKKWWGRKNKTATSNEIDNWDKESREWNEKRSVFKREIDQLLQVQFKTNQKRKQGNQRRIFNVLPIASMIDMMTIEKIKIYDLGTKKDTAGQKTAQHKLNAIKKLLDSSIVQIAEDKEYLVTEEARTF